MNIKYHIVSLSSLDAHIIEATGGIINLRNHVKTYRIYCEDSRYKFVDLEKEAAREFESRRAQIDPRILLDESKTIDDILNLPQMKDRKEDREFLESLHLILKYSPEDFRQEHIQEYDEAQKLSDEDLLKKIKEELKEKSNYVPQLIRNFTTMELCYGLPQADYEMHDEEFNLMDNALLALHNTWTDSDRRGLKFWSKKVRNKQ